MTRIRIRGFKIFADRHGKMRCYHRASGTVVDLIQAPIGSADFLAACARIVEKTMVPAQPRPGTLGLLIVAYRKSANFTDLAPRTRSDYQRMLDYMKPLDDMALVTIDKGFVVRLRDKAAVKGGRRFGNYVKAVLSIVLGWGAERGWIDGNPADKIKNIRRPKGSARSNRPWSDAERFAVLDAAPHHLRLPIALGMYVGLREGDALKVTRSAIKDGVFTVVTSKSGTTVRVPILSHLATIMAESLTHDAVTIAATSRGKPWTESGFRASWRTFRQGLEKAGKVEPGLTFHGLRHTVATILRQGGVDPRTIADALGQKTEGMALHYSRDADLSRNMQGMAEVFELSENRARSKVVKPKT